jgi:hypothetical protein
MAAPIIAVDIAIPATAPLDTPRDSLPELTLGRGVAVADAALSEGLVRATAVDAAVVAVDGDAAEDSEIAPVDVWPGLPSGCVKVILSDPTSPGFEPSEFAVEGDTVKNVHASSPLSCRV